LVAVDRISFNVSEREIISFLGPNGDDYRKDAYRTAQVQSGKGDASWYGSIKNTEKVQREIGVCFETPNLYEQMSAMENLKLFVRLFNIKNFNGEALLKRVGLTGREKDRVET
jgi:ABC-2 type transport system ATP-binding protein